MSIENKTAVQIAISEIKKRINTYQSISALGIEQLIKEENKRSLNECVEILEQLLGIEREKMAKFANEYADAVMGGCLKRAEQYYTEDYAK